MKHKHYIALLILFTTGLSCISCYFFIEKKFPLAIIFFIGSLYLFFFTINSIARILQDIDDFVEAVRYRDFSKRYPQKRGKRGEFYRYFNDISSVFLSLTREKEAQQHYLKRMLELVNTGILAYDIHSNDTLWMNDSLKNMFRIPYIRNINWLSKRNEKLLEEIIQIPLGENRLITINTGNQTIKTLINACTFQTDGKTYKLIAFNNVSATLEEVEAGAWKGLLNVMTHEIMNSIAPVASLADTLKKRMEIIKEEMGENIHPEFNDIEFAMETIHRRSDGLLRFADTYRSLSKIIVPQIVPVNLNEMLQAIFQLMYPSLKQKGISLEVKTDNPAIVADIDRNLIEQVLINFITNATHAVKEKENPSILLFSGISEEGNNYITVADNGCGISPEVRDKIFIPFFSTKKSGSGIGLSLSREIVKLHKGSLQVQSKEGEGSAFTVLFPLK